jgi:hypothetical protein
MQNGPFPSNLTGHNKLAVQIINNFFQISFHQGLTGTKRNPNFDRNIELLWETGIRHKINLLGILTANPLFDCSDSLSNYSGGKRECFMLSLHQTYFLIFSSWVFKQIEEQLIQMLTTGEGTGDQLRNCRTETRKKFLVTFVGGKDF